MKNETNSTKSAHAPAQTGSEHNRGDVNPDRRRAFIAEAAYYRAEVRGFEPGREVEDWVLAEIEVDAAIACGTLHDDDRQDSR